MLVSYTLPRFAGARLSTLLARLPFIPAADAYVCESGGRIFYPCTLDDGIPSAAPFLEDIAWRSRHAEVCGLPGEDTLPPERRTGTLWRYYGDIVDSAPQLKADAVSYTTAFRLKGPVNEVQRMLSALPSGLATAANLGAADVFPATSGKEKAATYLMQRLSVTSTDCAFMCGA